MNTKAAETEARTLATTSTRLFINTTITDELPISCDVTNVNEVSRCRSLGPLQKATSRYAGRHGSRMPRVLISNTLIQWNRSLAPATPRCRRVPAQYAAPEPSPPPRHPQQHPPCSRYSNWSASMLLFLLLDKHGDFYVGVSEVTHFWHVLQPITVHRHLSLFSASIQTC